MNIYEFNIIDSQSAINDLMTKFNGFHDCCIKEIKYISGGFVDQNGAINPFDSIRTLTAIFQSQNAIARAIEMQFEKVVRLNLCPKGEMEDAVIYGASIISYNGLFYWSSLCDINLYELEKNDHTWISSEKISWRAINNCLGDKVIY